MSAKSSRTILSIDRSEPRFESRTGGKIRITLKNNKNFDVFLKIFCLNQIQNCSGQSRKWKTIYLAFN